MLKLIFTFLLVSCSILQKNSSYSLRDYSVESLPNGLHILYVPDHKLPYLNLTVYLKTGTYYDENGKSGSTQMMLSMLNKGTHKRSFQEIASEIEGLGAEFSVKATKDYLAVDMEGLSLHDDQLLNNLADILFHPKFDAVEFEKLRARSVAQIQQSFNQSKQLRELAFRDFYFGKSPYSKADHGSIADLKKLTINDIKDRYEFHFKPENAWVVVVGKYTPELKKKIKDSFSLWKPKKLEMPTVENIIPEIKGRNILLVNKSDLNQAEITFAHKGILRNAPDYLEAQIANSILGQGFSSRLIDRIRVQLGLTYSVSSQFEIHLNEGVWTADTFTKSESVGQLVKEVYKVLEDFYEKGVTVQEVEVAKGAMSGKFPMLLETAERVAFNLVYLRIFGIEDSYLTKYQENLSKVKPEGVNNAIRKYFDPNNIKVVIVGNSTKISPQLKGVGTVKNISYTSLMK